MPLSDTTPLNPAYFLDRAAKNFSERTAILDGDRLFSYREFGERSHRLAGLLRGAGAQNGDRIAALCTNSHVMLEMHNGVPMAGCALVPMNIRLSSQEMAYILENSGARMLIATQRIGGGRASAFFFDRRAPHPCRGGFERIRNAAKIFRALPYRPDGRNVAAGD